MKQKSWLKLKCTAFQLVSYAPKLIRTLEVIFCEGFSKLNIDSNYDKWNIEANGLIRETKALIRPVLHIEKQQKNFKNKNIFLSC